MFKSLKIYGVVLLLGLFQACIQQSKVSFSPDSGVSDVPVNAVVRIQYLGDSWIRPAELVAENFQLTVCAQTNPSTPGTSPTGGTTEEKPKTETPSTTPSTGTAVSTRFISRQFNVPIVNSDGVRRMRKRTDIMLIPNPSGKGGSPLKEGTDYCVHANAMKDMAGNLISEQDSTFHTEENGNFFFDSTANATFIYPPNPDPTKLTEVKSDSWIVFQFDRAVLPDDVHTTLCRKPNSDSEKPDKSDGVCQQWIEDPKNSLYQIESFPEKDGIVRAQYDVYAIAPGTPLINDNEPPSEFRLFLGLKEPAKNVKKNNPISFTASSTPPGTPIKDVRDYLNSKKIRPDFSYIPITGSDTPAK